MYVSTWRSACTVAETDFTLTVRVKEKSTGLPECRSSKKRREGCTVYRILWD